MRPGARRSIAKSTIMMAFFFTMPISMTMPIMAMTVRSMPNSISVDQRADAGRRQAGQDGQRVDEALVEHAEDDVDHQHGGEEQHALVGDRLLEDLGAALEAGGDGGRQADLAATPPAMAATACPSATPGTRLKEMVTDGSWAMWLTVSAVGLSTALRHRIERHERRRWACAPCMRAASRWYRRTSDRPRGSPGRCPPARRWSRPAACRRPSRTASRIWSTVRPSRDGDVAVDVDRRRRARDLQVGIHVDDARDAPHAIFDHAARSSRSASRSVDCMPNWYWARDCVVADVDRLDRLEEDVDAGHRGRGAAQAGDDLPGAVLALRLVAQRDEHAARIRCWRRCRRRPSTSPRRRRDRAGRSRRAPPGAPPWRRTRRRRGRPSSRRSGRYPRSGRSPWGSSWNSIARHHEGAERDRQHDARHADGRAQRPGVAAGQPGEARTRTAAAGQLCCSW